MAQLMRTTRLTDTSLIVEWFTESHGILKTVAKGARRPGSPFAGKLDLFFSAEISWSRARGGELHALREVAVGDSRKNIRRDYDATLLAAYFCRLLELAVEREHPEPELYDLLRRGLDHVNNAGASSRGLRHFEHELARMQGIGDGNRQAAPALREALGALPGQREQLLERLSGAGNFPFSDPESGL